VARQLQRTLLTSPFDVLRTRLQSDSYRSQFPPHRSIQISPTKSFRLFRASLRHFGEIFHVGSRSAIVHIGARRCFRSCRGDPDKPYLAGQDTATTGEVSSQAGRSLRQSPVQEQPRAVQMVRQKGVRGLYRGLSARYLGVAEITLHLALYEHMKILITQDRGERIEAANKSSWDHAMNWAGTVAPKRSRNLSQSPLDILTREDAFQFRHLSKLTMNSDRS
jgi:Mitochondrial carrier protein